MLRSKLFISCYTLNVLCISNSIMPKKGPDFNLVKVRHLSSNTPIKSKTKKSPSVTSKAGKRKAVTPSITNVCDQLLDAKNDTSPDSEDSPPLSTQVPVYTKLLNYVSTYQRENPNHVALVRVGDFYELYFDQADIVGKVLCLTVITKTIKGVSFRFTGIPSKTLHRHLNTLVLRNNLCVAVIEQFQDPKTKTFDRKVDRIYTPGTWSGEEEDDNSRINNYLLSITINQFKPNNSADEMKTAIDSKEELAMAWVDLSTGDFWVGTTLLKDFHYELARFRPKEIVLSEQLVEHPILSRYFNNWPSIITYEPDSTYEKYFYDNTLNNLRSQLSQFTSLEHKAGIGLLNYVEKTQGGRPLDLTLPLRSDSELRMKVSLATMRSLELFETQLTENSSIAPASLRNTRVTRQNSLFHILDQCQTRGGSRLLAERLTSPSTNLDEIEDRLDLIEFFVQNPHLLSQIQQQLKGIKDPPRLLQRISMGQSHPRDLLDLQLCLSLFHSIKEILSSFVDNKSAPNSVIRLFDQIEQFESLQQRIHSTIHPPPDDMDDQSEITQSWINPNFNKELTKLQSQRSELNQSRADMEQELQFLSGLKSLKLLSNNLLGQYLEIQTKDRDRFIEYSKSAQLAITPFQSLKGKTRYYLKAWTELAIRQQETEQLIYRAEQKIYQDLIDSIALYSGRILIHFRLIAQIDLGATMAQLANQYHLTRPKFVPEPAIHIKGGRHLAVERSLMDKMTNFVRNDCYLTGRQGSKGVSPKNTWIITGPNMGGKSTFLRQTALISIMAQSGLFVPTELAELGIVDQVFSRIGSADHLTLHKSTFFLEMEETANILNNATHRSLVIIDEIGRGTSSDEGLALAYAILHRLHAQIGCLTLFATHFHQLADRTNRELPGVIPYYSTIKEDEGGFTYFHKMKLGVSTTSHAIRAAQLASVPPDVIAMAESILKTENSSSEAVIPIPSNIINNEFNTRSFQDIKKLIEAIDLDKMSMKKVEKIISQLKVEAKNLE